MIDGWDFVRIPLLRVEMECLEMSIPRLHPNDEERCNDGDDEDTEAERDGEKVYQYMSCVSGPKGSNLVVVKEGGGLEGYTQATRVHVHTPRTRSP